MNNLDLVLEEILGDQAIVYFCCDNEKLHRIISGTYHTRDIEKVNTDEIYDNIYTYKKKGPCGNVSRDKATDKNTYLFTVTSPNDKSLTTRNYGNNLVKAAVKGLHNFYFTHFEEYKKINPRANPKTWRMEQIKKFHLEPHAQELLGKGYEDIDGKETYSNSKYNGEVNILTAPYLKSRVKGVEYAPAYSGDEGMCLLIFDYRTIQPLTISTGKGIKPIKFEEYLKDNNYYGDDNHRARALSILDRGRKDLSDKERIKFVSDDYTKDKLKSYRKNNELDGTAKYPYFIEKLKNKIDYSKGYSQNNNFGVIFYKVKDYKLNGVPADAYVCVPAMRMSVPQYGLFATTDKGKTFHTEGMTDARLEVHGYEISAEQVKKYAIDFLRKKFYSNLKEEAIYFNY